MQPLSPHTVVKVVTQGQAPVALSVEVTKAGPVAKAGTTVKTENVNVEVRKQASPPGSLTEYPVAASISDP